MPPDLQLKMAQYGFADRKNTIFCIYLSIALGPKSGNNCAAVLTCLAAFLSDITHSYHIQILFLGDFISFPPPFFFLFLAVVWLRLLFSQTKYFWTNKQTRLKILEEGTLGTAAGELEGSVAACASAGREASLHRSPATTHAQKAAVATLVPLLSPECFAKALALF